MRHAVITGSFDPVTSGHEDLIRRAAAMFDRVTVLILANTEKASGLFPPSERLRFCEAVCSGIPGADAMLWGGLTSDAMEKIGARFIVRGARSGSDFDYEYSLAAIMKRFDPAIETLVLPAAPTLAEVSSTYVRDLLKYGAPLGDAVPEVCRADVEETYRRLADGRG